MEMNTHAQFVTKNSQSIVFILGTRGQQQDHVARVVTIHTQESIKEKEEIKTNTYFHKTHFEEEHSTYIHNNKPPFFKQYSFFYYAVSKTLECMEKNACGMCNDGGLLIELC